MGNTRKARLIVVFPLILLWACNIQKKQPSGDQSKKTERSAGFESVRHQFQDIREVSGKQGARMSPESPMVFHNMERLWTRINSMQAARMQYGESENGHRMMGNSSMIGVRGMRKNQMRGETMSIMGLHHRDQPMLSYSQGIYQMMQQSGNLRMAARYGQMITGGNS